MSERLADLVDRWFIEAEKRGKEISRLKAENERLTALLPEFYRRGTEEILLAQERDRLRTALEPTEQNVTTYATRVGSLKSYIRDALVAIRFSIEQQVPPESAWGTFLRARVRLLHEWAGEGKSATDIAHTLSMDEAQVEAILEGTGR